MKFKELIAIAVNLTIVCFFAGALLGMVNWGTMHAKEENQHKREVATSMSLLGYGPTNPAPASLSMQTISRYLLGVDGEITLGYVTPSAQGRDLVLLNIEGEKLLSLPAPDMQAPDVSQVLSAALDGKKVTGIEHVEDYNIALQDGQVKGDLIVANKLGFKANIRMMVAMNSDFSLRGIAILESEEDPGLGAEASQPYFKNQFVGKSAQQVARLQVVTQPLPDEYRLMLESAASGNFPPDIMRLVVAEYGDKPIYAITGSTISSRAVTVGVQKAVGRFISRLQQLQKAADLAIAPALEDLSPLTVDEAEQATPALGSVPVSEDDPAAREGGLK
jgi:electron transport complex protein RnfG